MIKKFKEFESKVKEKSTKPIVCVVCAHDLHTLEAIKYALDEEFIEVVLIGIENKIIALVDELKINTNFLKIIDSTLDSHSAALGVKLAKDGKIDVLMKGKIQTRDLLKAVVNSESGIKDSDVLSHVALLEIPSYHKIIGVSDGGMLPNPTLEQKIALTKNAVKLFNTLGYKKPKVGILAAVEVVNPKMSETIDADTIKNMNLPNCIVEGPIAYDLAFSKESAKTKGFESEITGDVDILIVPEIVSGNILSKTLIYSAGAKMAGIIVGAKVPIVLTSRGATAYEKYNSILLGALSK